MIISKKEFKAATDYAYREGYDSVKADCLNLIDQRNKWKDNVANLEKLNEKLMRSAEWDAAQLRACRAEIDIKRQTITQMSLGAVTGSSRNLDVERQLDKYKRAVSAGNALIDGYRLKVAGLRADKRVLAAERLELRQTVNSLTVQLGDAQTALRGAADMAKQHVPLKSGKISGKYFDVNSLYPNQVFNFTSTEVGRFVPLSELAKLTKKESFCVMECTKEFGTARYTKTPITSDETLGRAMEIVNARNEINQDSSVHYEIQVF